MEATVVSVAKSVLDGALGKAKSAVADEVALQLGVQRDLAFIKDEFDMMQTFLMAADEDRAKKKVVKTWVKQVRDLAYDAEDCLQDFSVHLQKPSWWRFPRTLRTRHRIAKEIKELKARVEDVSQRNLRYRLIEDSNSNPAADRSTLRSSVSSSAAIFGTDEPRIVAANKDEPKVDLCQLITADDQALRVISVWGGASDDLKKMSIIREVYDNQEIYTKFGCHAWIKLMNPVNPNDFFQSLVRQFYLNSLRAKGKAEEGAATGVGVLKKMTVTAHDHLIDEFDRYVNENRYLIAIDDLSTVMEWDWIKTCFPDRKNGSRIVVSTEKVEIARLCTGQPNLVSKLNQLSTDQPLYVFYNKPESSSNNATAANSIQPVVTDGTVEDQSTSMGGSGTNSANGKSLARNRTMQAALEESQLVGREAARSDVVNLILQEHCQVISVWGMGGLGKTTLVRSVYGSAELSGKFQKRAWVTLLHPFNPEEFFRSLALQLHTDNTGKDVGSVGDAGVQKRLPGMQIADLIKKTFELLKQGTYLIVLDDLSSNTEWDSIIPHLPKSEKASRIIITTRDASVASRCSMNYKLKSLGDDAALDLFKKKVFSGTEKVDLADTMMEQAELILKKCDGLPLAIATIGSFLATKPKTTLEWRKLNDHISVELENNPELDKIKTVLTSSYDGLPYHLKSCFLYLSIFPEDHNIRHGRLVRRWIAEGYSREVRSKTAEEVAEEHFTDIINRSMIQPSKTGTRDTGNTDFCQVHDLMREISISKSEEENLVFILDEHSTLQSKNKVRHLVVSRSWSRDQKKDVLGSILDVSHIRSLTVFGEWRSFFISKKMRLLRVLDLEDAEDLRDHDLVPIGDLRHLKYLSLRGCVYIYHLPDSFGNLSDLETLDIRRTRVITLPASIVKLSKLKYLDAGLVPIHEGHSWERRKISQPLKEFGSAAYESYLRRKSIDDLDALPYLCFQAGVWLRGWDEHGVKVPRGIGRLKALHTLGVVNIARGKAMLKELKKLSQLRKLGVTGINKKNCKELCSAIANHGRLRSLSMRAEGEPGLEGCLDDLSSPPNDLQSLELYGRLVKLPTWIEQIQMLAKLTLRSARLEHDAIVVLGELPHLAILCLRHGSLKVGELRFHFRPDTFKSLTVLELSGLDDLKSVEFEEKATPKLELLRVRYCFLRGGDEFSGIRFLSSLKEVSLKFPDQRYFDKFRSTTEGWREISEGWREISEGLRDQLAENKNKPHLKIED